MPEASGGPRGVALGTVQEGVVVGREVLEAVAAGGTMPLREQESFDAIAVAGVDVIGAAP